MLLFSRSKVKVAAECMERGVRCGSSPEDAWNEHSIDLAAASAAHCRAFMVDKFVEAVTQSSVSEPLRKVLYQLAELYVVHWLLNSKGDFLMVSTCPIHAFTKATET